MGKRLITPVLAVLLSLGLAASLGAAEAPPQPANDGSTGTTVNTNALPTLPPADSDAEPDAAQAQNAQSQTTVTLQVNGAAGPLGQRTYNTVQQVERLLALLPGSDAEKVQAPENPGNLPVEMTVTTGDTARRYLFYSLSYCKDETNPENPVWYATSSALWDLLVAMTDWNPYALSESTNVEFNSERITAMYSLLFKNRTYHQILEANDIQKIVEALEEKEPDDTLTSGNVGFLIFTENGGRYAYYFDMSSDTELVSLSSEYTGIRPRIQWISYMSPDMIKSIKATVTIGDNSYTGTAGQHKVTLNTANEQSIQDIAKYLKNIQVQPEIKRGEEEVKYTDNARYIEMDITFESGTIYYIRSNGTDLTISASSMEGEYITYTAASSQIAALRDFISVMPGAKISEVPAASGSEASSSSTSESSSSSAGSARERSESSRASR